MAETISVTEAVSIEIDGPLAVTRFQRGDSKVNALSMPVLHGLADAARLLARRSDLTAAVLLGRPDVFSAGFDLKSEGVARMAHGPDEDYAELVARAGGEAIEAWANLPAITVAALEKYALGGGAVLALACDFRVGSADCRIATPEIDRGITPGWGGVPRLTAICGLQMARRLVLRGETIGAEEAHRHLLIDEVAPEGQAAAAAIRMAESFLEKSGLALRMNKRLLNATAVAPNAVAAQLDVDQFASAARATRFRAEQKRFSGT